MSEQQAMTVKQLAEYLNINIKVIYKLVQTGDLPGFKVSGTWRFRPEDIQEWIEKQIKK